VRSAEEAILRIDDGQTVFAGSACGEPPTLIEALVNQHARFNGVSLLTGVQGSKAPYAAEGISRHIRLRAFSPGAAAEAIARGDADYLPTPLSQIPRLFEERRIPLDVVLVQVSEPGPDGRRSLGVSVAYSKAAVRAAPLVIAEVNRRMPRTLGNGFLEPDELHVLVDSDRDVLEVRGAAITDSLREIGRHVARLVPDRATVQVGVGAIAEAVWQALAGHRDLGVHSGSIGDGVIDLIESGVVTNKHKRIDADRIVAGQLIGTRRLYAYAHENPLFDMRTSDYTHSPLTLAQLDGLVSINSAVQVDLRGQINAESLGGRAVGGVGGAVDFTLGATLARGGRSIVALQASAGGGKYSRIVKKLDDAVVTTPASVVDYVVTEYGIAELTGKSLAERAEALRRIAAPEHVAALRKD
jgi:4-hydroxybutyrate CoA-transferase